MTVPSFLLKKNGGLDVTNYVNEHQKNAHLKNYRGLILKNSIKIGPVVSPTRSNKHTGRLDTHTDRNTADR